MAGAAEDAALPLGAALVSSRSHGNTEEEGEEVEASECRAERRGGVARSCCPGNGDDARGPSENWSCCC